MTQLGQISDGAFRVYTDCTHCNAGLFDAIMSASDSDIFEVNNRTGKSLDEIWAMRVLARNSDHAKLRRGQNSTWSCAACTLSFLDALAWATEANISRTCHLTGISHDELRALHVSARNCCPRLS